MTEGNPGSNRNKLKTLALVEPRNGGFSSIGEMLYKIVAGAESNDGRCNQAGTTAVGSLQRL